MKKKYYYIDFLRIFSMLSVVFLHTVADLLRTCFNTPVWHFSNILTSLFSVSVPVFFMISGAMLLSNEKSKSISELYTKRLKKVFLPFLFWSFIAILYYFLTDYFYYNTLNYSGVIYRLKHILSEPVTIHLWFMYALIPIYIILPFLKVIIDNINKKQAIYMFLVWVIFSVVLTTCQNFVYNDYKIIFTMNNSFNLNIIGGYVGFFILGYYLHNYDFKIKKRWLSIFIIADIVLISLGTFYVCIVKNAYFEGFKVYCGIFTTLLSVALFILFKKLFNDVEKLRFPKILSIISETSFAVYLIHNLVIHFFNLNYFLQPENGIVYVLLRFFAVYIVSFIIVYVLSYIKPLSFITTGIQRIKK